jgi:hypothetical protein
MMSRSLTGIKDQARVQSVDEPHVQALPVPEIVFGLLVDGYQYRQFQSIKFSVIDLGWEPEI